MTYAQWLDRSVSHMSPAWEEKDETYRSCHKCLRANYDRLLTWVKNTSVLLYDPNIVESDRPPTYIWHHDSYDDLAVMTGT